MWLDVNFHHLAKSEGTPVDKNIVIHPGIVYFRPLSIFLECYKHVYREIPMHSSVINIRYYPYEAAREKIPVSTNSGDFYGFLWNHRCMGMGWTYRRAESIVTIEIFRGKKIWKKNINFSWRNHDFRIWVAKICQILEN